MLQINVVIQHSTKSVNCHLGLKNFNKITCLLIAFVQADRVLGFQGAPDSHHNHQKHKRIPNLSCQGNEQFELFSQGTYNFQNLGNETLFIADHKNVKKSKFDWSAQRKHYVHTFAKCSVTLD